MVTATTLDHDRALSVASSVVDPEIPVLSIAELGSCVFASTGTGWLRPSHPYSGCPAMRQIEDDLRSALGARASMT